jgi:hypothetical protein
MLLAYLLLFKYRLLSCCTLNHVPCSLNFQRRKKLNFGVIFDPFLDPHFWPFLTLFGPPFFGHFWPFFRRPHMQVFICHYRHSRHLDCLEENFLRLYRKPYFTPFTFVFWSAGYRKTLSVQIIEVLFENFFIFVGNVENFCVLIGVMKKTRKMSKNRVFSWPADPLGPHRPPDFPVFWPFFDYFCVARDHRVHRHRMYKIFYMLIVTDVLSIVTSMSLEHEKWSKNRASGKGSKIGVFGGPEPAPPSTVFRAEKYFFQY